LKKVLTISSSFRPRGNGEALLTLCQKFLPESEFLTEKLYLKDLNIKNCTGCMKCAINRQFCHLEDDLKTLIDKILDCDFLLISSPVYFLGAASIIKAINDRLLFMNNLADYLKRKPAGIIITAGREGWEGQTVQTVSTLLLTLGFYIKDLLVAYGQGPSEVLLDENIEDKIKVFTERIIDSAYKVRDLSERCPVCFGNSFNILNQSTVKCPVCNLTGKIKEFRDNKTLILFSESDINNSRWSEKNLKDHMENWVAGSGLRYKEKVKEILKRRKSLLDK
jgi:multimeric flavodoxin WrbA